MATSENTKTVLVAATDTLASGGTAALTTAEVDSLGYDRARFVLLVGTAAASSGISTIVPKHSDTSGSGYTSLTTITDPVGATDDNGRYEVVVSLEDKGRYLDFDVTTAESGNIDVTAICILERGDEDPAEDAGLIGRSFYD